MKFEFMEKGDRSGVKIKVIGIGGAGGNAINNMVANKLRGVDFIVANTDLQDLERSACGCRIQLGPTTTMGLGTGADEDIGRAAAEESLAEIADAIDGANMVFIAAGMGGGTGTGASPVIARLCKEKNALTVAVVTKPFGFEGDKRMKKALAGLDVLRKEVDSLIVIPNERLKSVAQKGAKVKELFARADEVLLNAVRGVSDLILNTGFVNLDFNDVKRVMSQNGNALMGMGRANGENRAVEAAQKAINSPLLEDVSISGAKGLLMNFIGSSDITMDEIDEASNYVKNQVNEDAEVFWGLVLNDDMGDEVQATVIATGISAEMPARKLRALDGGRASGGIARIREASPDEADEPWTVRVANKTMDMDLDRPAFERRGVAVSTSFEAEESKVPKRGFFGRLLKDDLDYPAFLRLKTDS
jgi:cell division protein FtsZ